MGVRVRYSVASDESTCVNPLIDSIYAAGQIENMDGDLMPIEPASILAEDGRMLYDLVRKKPGRSLEIGLAHGLAALFMLQAHRDNGGGHHTAIDPYQELWFKQCGVIAVDKMGPGDAFRFFQQRTHETLPQFFNDGERFDVIFIDGNHRFEYIMFDLFYTSRMLNVGGYLVLHDPWMPSTRKAISFIVHNLFDEFRLYEPALAKPPSLPGKVYAFLQNVRRNPYDLAAARLFAATRFHNYAVFEKIDEYHIEHCDIHWDFYRPF